MDFVIVRIITGARFHLHLNPMTAANTGEALTAMAVMFAALAALLSESVVPAFIAEIVSLVAGICGYDYYGLYNGDRNADNSFDLWFEANYQWLFGFTIMETPNYFWWVGPIGAYEIKDKRQPLPSNVHGSACCSAHAI